MSESDRHGVEDSSSNSLLTSHNQHLVEGINCSAPSINDFPADLLSQEQRASGFLTIHVLIDLYLFYSLAIVCSEYFVPAVERIAQELKIPSDIAGCTIMGIANSSPELFTNIIGTFVTEGDLGIGTIVGASVFNILAVGAAIGLCTERLVSVSWWSISRDSLFYLISIAIVYQALLDYEIRLQDSIMLLVLYFLYILFIYFNTPLKSYTKRLIKRFCSNRSYNVSNVMSCAGIGGGGGERTASVKTLTSSSSSGSGNGSVNHLNGSAIGENIDDGDKIPDCCADEENLKLCELPSPNSSWSTWLDFIVGWPVRFFLKISIPDCKTESWSRWYFVTFFMCIIWNTVLCYVVSWMTTVIGHTVGVPDGLMGLTVIAAGTSVPQVVSSVIVARKGLGTMAMNNAIGSNIFNVLVCCSVPWIIRILLDSSNISIHSHTLEYSTLMLIAATLFLYSMLACNRFVFDKKIGLIALICYVGFLIIGSLFEMNVFFEVNLPHCPIL